MKYDYLIVGSGLSGATFAYEAAKKAKRCLLIEKREHLAGNIYCEKIEDINVHKYGAHIFHTNDKMVWDYVNRFADFNNFVNCPVANYHGEILNMPFNMNTFSRLWGVVSPDEAKAIIDEQKKEITGEPRNLEEQAIRLVGRDVYEKLVKGYTEKQWGRSCEDLPAFLIKRLPVRYTYDNDYFGNRYQGIPIGGYNVLIDRMLIVADIETEVDFLIPENREKYGTMADKIVYTGQLDAYYEYKLGKLEYRTLRFDTEILDEKNHQGVAVMNYTDRETPYTRSIEHKHFEFGNQPKTVITKENPAEWEEGMEPYFPVNDERNQKLLAEYQKLAKDDKNVIFLGRLAEYKYFEMDEAIANAISRASEVL
ncbi:MAG: UDP-galactopyranose mutase [Clostridiales Family XIII bacterium]|jgi:UDP-galactopyranose mutase|nr:UDP-galactopyranose mutase [Clostridiales Family XIII bacterium]